MSDAESDLSEDAYVTMRGDCAGLAVSNDLIFIFLQHDYVGHVDSEHRGFFFIVTVERTHQNPLPTSARQDPRVMDLVSYSDKHSAEETAAYLAKLGGADAVIYGASYRSAC